MNNKPLTLGSLFDGSGGFPLGALLEGITPVWASEIDPFAIRVTTKRLPFMRHYGDINRINGAEIEPVDVITFGSPCVGMSVAGKREGLKNHQSVLFYEAVRVIKEMRRATYGQYPRFIVWENVPGAYSSAGGNDFREVLSEIVKIKDGGLSVPMPESGKWLPAGEIVGDGFSAAWRTIDAQHFGIPQRRRRCYLVADFAGGCAGKILFESEGVSGYPPQGFGAGQGTAGHVERSAGAESRTVLNDQGGSRIDISENITGTLRAREHGHPPLVFEPGAASRVGGHAWGDAAGTLRVSMGDNRLTVVYGAPGNGRGITGTITGDHSQDNKSATLSCNNDQTVFVPFRKGTRPHNKDEGQNWEQAETTNTLNTFDTGESRCNELAVKVYGICSDASNAMRSDNPASGVYEAKTSRTLDGSGGNPSCNQGGMAVVALQGSMIGRDNKNGPQGSGVNDDVGFTLNTIDKRTVAYDCRNHAASVVSGTLQAKKNGGQSLNYINPVAQAGTQYTVRRLVPQECALLQGFPPDWCANLGTSEPAEAEIAWWSEVFETHRLIMGTSGRPKSRNQIIKWLRNPHSDSAEYRLWGNGVALPCVRFVMAGIAWAAERL